MSWDWISSIEQSLRGWPVSAWGLLAVAGLLGLLLPVVLLRTERSFANGLLAALTFAALAVAVATQLKTGSPDRVAFDRPPGIVSIATAPAIACVDDMAGETALAACEKVLFGAPDTVAAAVHYASIQLSRLTAVGDVAAANREMSPQLFALRRAVERDRYGIFAYVLASRDNCQPEACTAYSAMTDHNQIAANMNDLIYEGLVSRYAPTWNAAGQGPSPAAQAALSGRPSTIDFPTAASIPPVNIMSAEPPPVAASNATQAAPSAAAPVIANNSPAAETPRESEGAKKSAARARSAGTTSSIGRAKRQPSAKQSASEPEGPVQLTPANP